MTTTVLVMTPDGHGAKAVAGVAAAIAATLGLPVRALPAPTRATPASVAELERAVGADDVRLAVLAYAPGHRARLAMEVIGRCSTPLVLVPTDRALPVRPDLARVLVPLDGTEESAETVAEVAALFAASGVDIVVLHVIDETTVPMFWDQPAHARETWDEEFLRRFCRLPGARLELRAGRPGEQVVDVAETEHADLVALGWSQDLSPGHARTVRAAVARAGVPVLLLPVRRSARRGGVEQAPAAGAGDAARGDETDQPPAVHDSERDAGAGS